MQSSTRVQEKMRAAPLSGGPGKTRKYKGLQRAAESNAWTLQAIAAMLAPAPLAQWIECWPPKPKVARSNRAGRAMMSTGFSDCWPEILAVLIFHRPSRTLPHAVFRPALMVRIGARRY